MGRAPPDSTPTAESRRARSRHRVHHGVASWGARRAVPRARVHARRVARVARVRARIGARVVAGVRSRRRGRIRPRRCSRQTRGRPGVDGSAGLWAREAGRRRGGSLLRDWSAWLRNVAKRHRGRSHRGRKRRDDSREKHMSRTHCPCSFLEKSPRAVARQRDLSRTLVNARVVPSRRSGSRCPGPSAGDAASAGRARAWPAAAG